MARLSALRTRELINNALQKVGMNLAEVNIFCSGVVPSLLSAEIIGFEILLGSNYVNCVHRMLVDYPATM
jgi:hypothetical protein